MDFALVSNTTILVSIGEQYYYFGKHLGPFGKLRYFIAEANQTRDIRVSINHSYTLLSSISFRSVSFLMYSFRSVSTKLSDIFRFVPFRSIFFEFVPFCLFKNIRYIPFHSVQFKFVPFRYYNISNTFRFI